MPSHRSKPRRKSAHAGNLRRPGARGVLMAGIGAYVSLTTFSAHAGDILRGGSTIGAKPGSAAANGQSPAVATQQAAGSARDALARTTQAMQAVQKMQMAARSAALKSGNNLGLNPNRPGTQLPNVPNGLRPGGLQVAPGVPVNLKNPVAGENPGLWRGALLPKETAAGGETTVTIRQTAPQAVLNWKTFNVGKETTVDFNQKAGTQKDGSNNWIAFNKINDPSGVPSQILGNIKADGSVYLINQNGIIFGGGSQINLHSLVASSLPINDNLLSRGLLNNPDSQFLFSALPQTAGANGTPAFSPPEPTTPNGRIGDVTVQPGAIISAPSNSAHVGGRVALIGANVDNKGTISTPDGQTILAAGLQVGFAPHASSDPSLRGLDVYVGAIVQPPAPPVEGQEPAPAEKIYAGTATNSGFIDAARANVTITGKLVRQLGAIASSTSVSLNGRVDLLADYNAVPNLESNTSNTSNTDSTGGLRNLRPYAFLPKSSGTVMLGPGSTIQILPELESAEAVVGTQLPLASQVNIQGRTIHLDSDSALLAPNANAGLNAGQWRFIEGATPRVNFVNAGGQIYLEPGALINVAGSAAVAVPIAQNILSVELRGTELADSPLQRDGIFRGTTIQVDIRQSGITAGGRMWVGTPLADVSGYIGIIQRTVGELTTAGGNVKLNAGASVVMQPGSVIDVSGGWIDYQGGMVQTTRVISGNRILDISQVTPDLVHEGFYSGKFTRTAEKYGISETFTNPLLLDGAHFEEGYTFGANGGTISITAPAMALDGKLLGRTIAGPRQRQIAPLPSALTLAFQAQDLSISPAYPLFSPTPPSIVFQGNTSQPAAGAFALDAAGEPLLLSAERLAQVVLSPELLSEDGFGILRIINPDGDITVPAGVRLAAPAGGSIALKGANISILGDVSAPGGALSFEVFDVSQSALNTLAIAPLKVTPLADFTRGRFTLGAGATLSTAGLIVDDRPGAPDQLDLPLATSGGSISIAGYSAELARGSTIDVSGGVAMGAPNRRTYGAAGSISIAAGQDLQIKSVLGGELELGATLRGFSGSRGGSLSILAPLVQIGGSTANADTLLLSPDFFNQGGFGAFAISGIGAADPRGGFLPAVAIAPGTIIAPQARSFLAVPDSGGGSGTELMTALLPEGFRTPVTLSFNATGATDTYETSSLLARGDFIMGAGARIVTDARGGVSISGNTAEVLGSILTPSGSISITGRNNTAILLLNPTEVLANVHLGSDTVLSTAGTTLFTPDARGFRTGVVLPGGSIRVAGNIVAEAGAMLDVSGVTDTLDMRPAFFQSADALLTGGAGEPLLRGSFAGFQMLTTPVDSSAGSIALAGDQALFTHATLRGVAGGPSAQGGTLSISSGRFRGPSALPQTPLDATLTVTQADGAMPVPFRAGGGSFIGQPIADAQGRAIAGQGYFSVDQFQAGGFDALSLGGTVQFRGAVTIDARRELRVADGGVLFADNAVNLIAPHVVLGTPFQAPFSPLDSRTPFSQGSEAFNFDPTFGKGSLTVQAALIDIGNLSLQRIGKANFFADGGDIRGDGTLNVAGDITLRAGQIYPPTAVSFTIAATDRNVLVASSATGNPAVTLASAALPPGFGIGSPLLGSTVQSIEGKTVTLAAGANATIAEATAMNFAPGSGSVAIVAAGSRPLPLSAAGELNIHGSRITQGGMLRAPLGTINIGWDGTGDAPKDLITGKAFAVTQKLTIAAGSITSVAAIDPETGRGMVVPFGINLNDASWIDPTGTDITAGGVPGKGITISGVRLFDRGGSVVDLRGGGDLYAYRFVAGTGGSQDILASPTSFAVLPGYDFGYAPFAAFNNGANAGMLGGDPGLVNSGLAAGDRVHLGASDGLPEGTYTLLPARYALTPGAFLVTPQSGIPVGSFAMADGSSIVSGFRFNDGSAARTEDPLNARFEVARGDVLRQRAEYRDYFGNRFFTASAVALGIDVPRLPIDAGHLILSATQAMTLKGHVFADALEGGRGGLVDIASATDILITGNGARGGAGKLVLSAADLSAFGADSLLIGGIREFGANGATIAVRTGNLTVDNAGTALTGPEIILAANKALTLDAGAIVEQTGDLRGGGDTLFLGNASVPGSGDGVLLRVTADADARVVRRGLGTSTEASMTIGAGARIAGAGLLLDSTYATSLDPNATLDGDFISLNSGQISLLLDEPGTIQPTVGLVLAGRALASLQSAQSLSLLSYSTLDVYGTGAFSTAGRLALHAAEVRGFNNGGGKAAFSAPAITLDNAANGKVLGSTGVLSGTLALNAGTIRLGRNKMAIDQFETLELNARRGILVRGAGGLAAQGALAIETPVIAAGKAAEQAITAGGAFTIEDGSGKPGAVRGGLGARLTLQGSSLTANSNISLPSGMLTLHATGGDLTIGGRLDAGGTAQIFQDLTRFTGGGQVRLVSDTGSVAVTDDGRISVGAEGGAGAGSIVISAPQGGFALAGEMAGSGGAGGAFSLNVASVPGGSVGALNAVLNDGGFAQSRTLRLRTGDVLVDGTAKSHVFNLSADQGSITVIGAIDASGATGGRIDLQAAGSVTLQSGARLSVAGEDFSHAGKGGAVLLAAGSQTNGAIDPNALVEIETGSTIDLSVASNTANSAAAGDFSGTLHLRAPQTAGGADVQIAAVGGTVLGASSVVVEGYQLYTPAGGNITSSVQNAVRENGVLFTGNTSAITARLFAGNAALADAASIVPGAEIINAGGNLTLGTANSNSTSDWDLSTFRFGPDSVPGVLTLRAAGNLVFFNALSDGFTSSAYDAALLAQNPLLSANAQGWSYRLTAGADFSAADARQVQSIGALGADAGSLLLGKNYGTNVFTPSGPNAQTRTAVASRFQVIRTGSGDIDISAGRDVKLLNQFSTIYTAGTQVADATVLPGGAFDVPIIDASGANNVLGNVQQNPAYPAQYSLAGGNVSISAGGDIAHQTRSTAGQLIADSSRELPNNWLYRRGFVDAATGEFGKARFGDIASTTWWVDFSNFFEGVGALGGGDVTLLAGRDISNVDAVAPTNARMPKGAPNAANLVELGGGDVAVRAGHDIDGGVYYVERGTGTLAAGNTIHTNATRSPSLGAIANPVEVFAPQTWLPTTLFVGKGNFDVSAASDVTLGPVSNPFLLPAGFNNSYTYKTYFSTYSPDSAVNITSLGGSVTMRTEATLPTGVAPMLQAWLQNVSLFKTGAQPSVSFFQPWLRLSESSVAPFATVLTLMPGSLRATAFSGDINLVGDLTLSPSPRGTIELVTAGSINGLQPTGVIVDEQGISRTAWLASQINLSDADPRRIPGVTSPLAFQPFALSPAAARTTGLEFLLTVDSLFRETGSTADAAASLQNKQALHGASLLHAGDPDPIRLYAGTDISGITTFSPKSARIIAGRDISDISFYLQNLTADDISLVSAGRDIVAYSANSLLRVAAQTGANILGVGEQTLAGDLQISGPGALEVLAGRNLDLGSGGTRPDGNGVGITSIGNARNPNLPFEGASVIAGAGIGPATDLSGSALDFDAFLEQLDPADVDRYLAEIQADRAASSRSGGDSGGDLAADFERLPLEQRNRIALEMFYRVLRDAGRGSVATGTTDATAAGAADGVGSSAPNYDAGYAAIDALFGSGKAKGDLVTRARDIRTKSGGDISLFVPGGKLTLAPSVDADTVQVPPGIITEAGGSVSIFTDGDVDLGVSRIFTLRGGDIIIWSSSGDIAAGSSSKTVQSAPPTRVVIDAQTADVTTDLAGLATGGGIGVLATVEGVPPGDVDLIAPKGVIDAGDAGIRSAGNLNVAATQILNASNIQVSGSSGGVPSTPSVAAPSLGGLASASNTAGAANNAASEAAKQQQAQGQQKEELPSIITVEVLGYGGGDGGGNSDEEEEERRRKREAGVVETAAL